MTELLPAPTLPTTTAFGPLEIAYDDRVLVPRAWTVLQSEWARELLEDAPPGPVLELCCGAGQIGLLAVHGTDRLLEQVDVDPVACRYAAENAAAAGRASRTVVRQGSIWAFRSQQRYPLVIADPPWVLTEHVPCFPQDPALAIDGGADGLRVVRECLGVISRVLHPDGAALLQLGSVAQVGQLVDELPRGMEAVDVRVEPGSGLVVKLVHT